MDTDGVKEIILEDVEFTDIDLMNTWVKQAYPESNGWVYNHESRQLIICEDYDVEDSAI